MCGVQTPHRKETGKGAESAPPHHPSREGVGWGGLRWQDIPSFIPLRGNLPAAGLFSVNPKRCEAEGAKGGWVTLHFHWCRSLSFGRSGLLCARIYHLRSGWWVILPIPRTDCTKQQTCQHLAFCKMSGFKVGEAKSINYGLALLD